MTPQISVLISTYNNQRFVAKKLAEIRRQTIFDRAEFIFVETASPERERELIAPFCAGHSNCRLITTDDRRTLYAAWNLGWDAARAPLLCYSNMDDTMHPALLERLVAAMQREAWDACSVLIAKQSADDPALDDFSPAHLKTLTLGRRPGPFSCWRAALKETVGQFDGQFVVLGDKDFWSRLTARQRPVGLLPKALYLYTSSPQQLSKDGSGSKWRDHDQQLLNSKDYPIGWHPGLERQLVLRRWLWRMHPGWFIEPPPRMGAG